MATVKGGVQNRSAEKEPEPADVCRIVFTLQNVIEDVIFDVLFAMLTDERVQSFLEKLDSSELEELLDAMLAVQIKTPVSPEVYAVWQNLKYELWG